MSVEERHADASGRHGQVPRPSSMSVGRNVTLTESLCRMRCRPLIRHRGSPSKKVDRSSSWFISGFGQPTDVDVIAPTISWLAVISTSAPAVLHAACQVIAVSPVNFTVTGRENDDPSPDQFFVETNSWPPRVEPPEGCSRAASPQPATTAMLAMNKTGKRRNRLKMSIRIYSVYVPDRRGVAPPEDSDQTASNLAVGLRLLGRSRHRRARGWLAQPAAAGRIHQCRSRQDLCSGTKLPMLATNCPISSASHVTFPRVAWGFKALHRPAIQPSME